MLRDHAADLMLKATAAGLLGPGRPLSLAIAAAAAFGVALRRSLAGSRNRGGAGTV